MLATEYEVVATVPCTVAVRVVHPLHILGLVGETVTPGQAGICAFTCPEEITNR